MHSPNVTSHNGNSTIQTMQSNQTNHKSQRLTNHEQTGKTSHNSGSQKTSHNTGSQKTSHAFGKKNFISRVLKISAYEILLPESNGSGFDCQLECVPGRAGSDANSERDDCDKAPGNLHQNLSKN